MKINAEELFRALADPTRLRALLLLHAEGELCVCDLTHALKLSQPKMSRHLANLRAAGLVVDRRDGQWIHYHIDPQLPAWVHGVLATVARANGTASPFRSDRAALKRSPGTRARRCAA